MEAGCAVACETRSATWKALPNPLLRIHPTRTTPQTLHPNQHIPLLTRRTHTHPQPHTRLTTPITTITHISQRIISEKPTCTEPAYRENCINRARAGGAGGVAGLAG